MQKHVKVCCVERSFSGFVDHRFARKRSKLRNEFPTRLASREDPSARSGISNSRPYPPAAPSFVFRKIRKIGPVALARVHDMKTAFTRRGQYVLNWSDRCPRQRKIVSHLVDIPSSTAKVSLHVD